MEGVKPTRKRGRKTEGGGYEDVEFLDSLPDGMITSFIISYVFLADIWVKLTGFLYTFCHLVVPLMLGRAAVVGIVNP